MVQVEASKVGGDYFGCSQRSIGTGGQILTLSPLISMIGGFEPATPHSKTKDKMELGFACWSNQATQSVSLLSPHCRHSSLQLETQRSFTLILFLSLSPSLSLSLSLADWQIYYHWFSLSLITNITLGISLLLSTIVVAPCVWLFLYTLHLLSDCW